VAAEPATLRRLLDQQQIRRVVPTRRQRAAATTAIGPTTRARAVRQRRQARLTELGFQELGVGYDWLDQQLTRLGLRD
jgi:hypothetical protein